MAILQLIEKDVKEDFYPLTLTRHFIDLHLGILSIREKWERLALKQNFPLQILSEIHETVIADKIIPANFIPPANLDLKSFFETDSSPEIMGLKKVSRLHDFVNLNSWAIHQDFELLEAPINHFDTPSHVKAIGSYPLYIADNVKLEHCYINTTDGPVYIDENAIIMDGAMLRGPIYIGKNSVVKMGATLYGGTSIGHHCIIGGEVKNSIFIGYTNKAHHGYIGDSYIGAWCNMGAGTSCSNLKNTVGEIKVWDMNLHSFFLAGQKVGIYMGDFVRSAINTSFNSGTVIGICSNVFEFPHLTDKFIPSFSWGGKTGMTYDFDKLMGELNKWMQLKGITLEETLKENIKTLYFKLNQHEKTNRSGQLENE